MPVSPEHTLSETPITGYQESQTRPHRPSSRDDVAVSTTTLGGDYGT